VFLNKSVKKGKGMMLLPNNSLYEGSWKDGNPHGVGRMIHDNGDIYCGYWREGRAHG
jgi:hypothetical protein